MPIVDDPYDFGRIAAANALSDVYAMGARPVFALAILGLPIARLGAEVGAAIMAGGAAACAEAGVQIAGGHSIDDTEPKFGLAVTGLVHPDRLLRNSTARVGDLLVLTKPLGLGALTTALKRGALSAEHAAVAVATMTTLNRGASEAALAVGVTAATDVTGFSLLGHTMEMAAGAGLGAELWVDRLPVLPGARDTLAAGIAPGATRRNIEHYQDTTTWDPSFDELDRKLVADPQTSGGLLLAVSPDRLDALLDALEAAGTLARAVVGRLQPGEGVVVGRAPRR